MDFTTQNVYKGLAGFYLLFDKIDSGDEEDTNSQALRLPSGEYDVPLLLQDKSFDKDGILFFDFFNMDGLIGDRYVVNGKIQPFFKVARRKYRFRLLNGSASRIMQLHLSNNHYMSLIGTDGNLLPRPQLVQSVRLAPAERADIVVDFARYRRGERIFLQNRMEQVSGRLPTGRILPAGSPLLRFDIDRDVSSDPSRVPTRLRDLPPVNLNEVVKTRIFRFGRSNGVWTINGQLFDDTNVMANPRINTAEVWVLENNSGGWAHPIHIHFEEFRILSRNGRPPEPHESGRKDVVYLGPGDTVRVFLRFRDFLGKYVMHCHNTVHEDHSMMLRWDVVP